MIEGIGKYWFLFGLALVWLVFAAVYDLKKREVPNWLNFTLIAFALAYRAFYSSAFSDWSFFGYGVLGFLMFLILGNIFYYARIFAGGDAKLLMGLGIVLPFEKLSDFSYLGLGFIMVLFLAGAAYSLIYSLFLAVKNSAKFRKEFGKNVVNKRYWVIVPAVLIILLLAFSLLAIPMEVWIICVIVPFLFFFLFVYLKAVDSCMIKLISPNLLTEGDWIIKDIKLKGYVVRKTVHGLSAKDIKMLRKAEKKIFIKEGIPFVPAILAAFLMVFFSEASGYGFVKILFSFLS